MHLTELPRREQVIEKIMDAVEAAFEAGWTLDDVAGCLPTAAQHYAANQKRHYEWQASNFYDRWLKR